MFPLLFHFNAGLRPLPLFSCLHLYHIMSSVSSVDSADSELLRGYTNAFSVHLTSHLFLIFFRRPLSRFG